LGNQKIILGLPWLRKYNPEINWKEGTLQWRTTTMEEVLDEEEHLNQPTNASDKILLEYLGMENELWINSKENLATKLASEANQKKPDLTPEQLDYENITITWTSSMRTEQINFLIHDHGITKSR
jgi:hypothetical protein